MAHIRWYHERVMHLLGGEIVVKEPRQEQGHGINENRQRKSNGCEPHCLTHALMEADCQLPDKCDTILPWLNARHRHD